MFGETLSLVFQSESLLTFDGEAAQYQLTPEAILVQEGYEVIAYGYQLDGKALQLSFPEGFQVSCTRVIQPRSLGQGALDRQDSQPSGAHGDRRGDRRETNIPKTQLSDNEVSDPSWGFKFKVPAGWKWQVDQSGALLGHDSIPGMILVSAHREQTLEGLTLQLQQGLTEEGVTLRPAGQLKREPDNLVTGEFAGIFQGQRVKGRGIGSLSPYGGGAYVLGVTTPDKYDQGVARAADAISSSLEYFKVEVSELVKHFSGMWAHYSGGSGGGTLLNYDFYPDGTFSDSSETSYNIQYSSDGWSTPDTSLGAVGVGRARARWTVRGSMQSGQIIITHPDGDESYIDYQVVVEQGQTYWGEYIFDGRRFSKRKSY